MNPPLSSTEVRVLGCLIEKHLSTPEYYPLTINSLLAACNQKSNREPPMQLGEADVAAALDSLRLRRFVWQVTAAGTRVPKYKHALPESLPLSVPQMAVLAELMLRGPQTEGELRTHAQRMAPLEGPDAVRVILDELSRPDPEPLIRRLARGAGQREERYAHLLSGEPAPDFTPAPVIVAGPEGSILDRLAALERAVASLRAELAAIRPAPASNAPAPGS